MKIIQITPGSGSTFYCENCYRDTTLAKALRKQGLDVAMFPLYLPFPVEACERDFVTPLFFGAVNVYLQQKSSWFRKTPRLIDRLFDSPRLLRLIGRRSSATSAAELGEMTLSMLNGEQGRQVKELERLVKYLAGNAKPDLVCLSNILLVGMVRRIKQELKVPVVCLLQDEDGFVDSLPQPARQQAWRLIAERSREVDDFIAVSSYYAQVMQNRLNLDAEKLHVVNIGVDPDDYAPAPAPPQAPVIGYLSRMCPDKGLDTLVEAFILLKQKDSFKNLKLRLAGGSTAGDKPFLQSLRQRLISHGLTGEVEFVAKFDTKTRKDFLRSLTLLSVPEKTSPAWGLYVLEALASGIPVVQPAIGVFNRLLAQTNGGVLVKEHTNPKALAQAIESLLLQPDYCRELGQKARGIIIEKYNIAQTAKTLMRVYENSIQKIKRGG